MTVKKNPAFSHVCRQKQADLAIQLKSGHLFCVTQLNQVMSDTVKRTKGMMMFVGYPVVQIVQYIIASSLSHQCFTVCLLGLFLYTYPVRSAQLFSCKYP